MKIAAINSLPFGSTGTIMKEIGIEARKKGIEYRAYYGAWADYNETNDEFTSFGFKVENIVSACISRICGIQHVYSILGTLQLISKLKKYSPDIIHIHNLHLWIINVPMLFRYIKKNNISVVWTLHDCWAFTGQCPHFSMIGCSKWKKGCGECPQIKCYPQSMVDNTALMWRLKKKWFSNVRHLLIVTPSYWLADLVQKSFLSSYSTMVINNGIDLSIFNSNVNDYKSSLIDDNKFLILGVAFDWGKKKGLDVFVTLSHMLPDKYQIVLVGVDHNTKKQLPTGIKTVERTSNREELAYLYTKADVLVNPTREDTYPTVNMESLACGTPVVTFDTGGSPEIIDINSGSVVACDDVDAMAKEIVNVCEHKRFMRESCVERAKSFNKEDRFKEYIQVYFDLYEESKKG